MRADFRLPAALLAACVLLWGAAVRAQDAAVEGLGGEAPAFSQQRLEGFFDGAIAAQFEAYDIPGGVVAVVRDGQVAFAKGYGVADAARSRPVDPDDTLFRVGSVSKLVTWTAVMQLADGGRIDLQRDVNAYLTQFQIPDAGYVEPVTMTHLLTHTAGFEDGALGFLFQRSPDDFLDPAEALETHMPARVRPPGVHAAYSNWGAALAGLIVANVSGLDFETYADERIFAPLGMTRSTFREPLPEALAAGMSAGLAREGGRFVEKDFEYVHNFAPAGAMSATAADMAKFMIAHLQLGTRDGARILSTEAASLMQSRLFGHHPALAGMAYGFYEQYDNGRRIIAHGGDTLYFHSNLLLIPEENVGLFVSFNAPDGARASRELSRAFMDAFFPGPDKSDVEETQLGERAVEYIGSYRANRRSYSKFEKFVSLFGDIAITSSAKGGLLYAPALGGEAREYFEASDDVFENLNDPDDRIAFERDANGDVVALFRNNTPILVFDRTPAWRSTMAAAGLLGAMAVLFLGVVGGSVWGVPKWLEMGSGEKIARAAIFLASLSFLGFVLAMGLIVVPQGNDLVFAYPEPMTMIMYLSLVGIVMTTIATFYIIPAWLVGFWSLFARLRYTVVTLGAAAFAALLIYGNAVGPWSL